MKLQALGLAATLVLTLFPSPAAAQQEFIKDKTTKLIQKIGVHVSSSFADPLDTKEAARDGSYGVSIGLAPGKNNGWRYPFGIGWYTEEFVAPNGAVFGELRARPFYGGVGYGWHFGRLSTGAQVQAGWSFNSLKAHGDPAGAFAAVPSSVFLEVGNAPSVRPQLKIEYFVKKNFTVRSSLNYVFMNPRVTISTPAGVISDRWNASNVSLAVGIGYYPFRK